MNNSVQELNPSIPSPDKQAAVAALDAWVVDGGARTQYESIFYSLNPVNNKLSGMKMNIGRDKDYLRARLGRGGLKNGVEI